MEKKWIAFYIICMILGISIVFVSSYTTYGQPSEFGNISTTTCWLGGDLGNLTCYGNASIGGYLDVHSATLYVDSVTDRVGIGTASPGQPLHIKSTTAGVGLRLDRASTGNDAFIQFATGGTAGWFVGLDNTPVANRPDFQIKTANNAIPEFIIIRTSGNVGIGTATPQQPLNVIGDGNFTGSLMIEQELNVTGDAFFNGNVGIGTASPDSILNIGGGALHINSTDWSNQISISHDNTDGHVSWDDGNLLFKTTEAGANVNTWVRITGKGSGLPVLELGNDLNGNVFQFLTSGVDTLLRNTGGGRISFQNTAEGDVLFFVSSGSGVTRELAIYGHDGVSLKGLAIASGIDAVDTASFDGVSNYYFDGNIGIGDSTPTFKLDVTGNGRFTTDLTINDDLTVDDFAHLDGVRIGATATDPGTGNLYVEGNIQLAGALLEDPDNEDFIIRTNSVANQLVLDSGGNVGIGTATPAKTFTVSGQLQATDYYSGDGTQGMDGSCDELKTIIFKDGLAISCLL